MIWNSKKQKICIQSENVSLDSDWHWTSLYVRIVKIKRMTSRCSSYIYNTFSCLSLGRSFFWLACICKENYFNRELDYVKHFWSLRETLAIWLLDIFLQVYELRGKTNWYFDEFLNKLLYNQRRIIAEKLRSLSLYANIQILISIK